MGRLNERNVECYWSRHICEIDCENGTIFIKVKPHSIMLNRLQTKSKCTRIECARLYGAMANRV